MRRRLTAEELILRPGFVELIGNLRAGALTFSALIAREFILPQLKRSARRSRIYRNLKALEKRGLIEFVKDSGSPPAPSKKGRPTTGAWRLTAKGQELWDQYPKIVAKDDITETVRSATVESMIPLSASPSTRILAINAPCVSDTARREIRNGRVPGRFELDNAAGRAAWFFWRRDSTFERDWRTFQTIRRKYPRDRDEEIPGVPRVAEPVSRLPLYDLLQFKDHPGPYRRARGRLTKHSITFVITANPALWAESDTNPHLEGASHTSGPVCAERVNSDTEGTGTCDLPTGHDGPHYARVTWADHPGAPFAHVWDSGGPLRRLYEQPSPSRPGRKRGK
jgi:hypothetical protein